MSTSGSLFDDRNAHQLAVRETLFGARPVDEWPPDGRGLDGFPWTMFVSARRHLANGRQSDAIADWRKIIEYPGLEARHYLQAWHFLRQQGEQPPEDVAKQVLGVVVEVGMPEGLDLLAAYKDHSARYYNYSGSRIVWEHPDTSLDATMDEMLEIGSKIVTITNTDPIPFPPATDNVRLSLLTPIGQRAGIGPMGAMLNHPFGGPLLRSATVLMTSLIEKANAERGQQT